MSHYAGCSYGPGRMVGWLARRKGGAEDMRVRKAGFLSKSLLIGHKGCQVQVFRL